MFLNIQVSGDQSKKKAKEKLTIKKWPRTFDRMNCLGLGIHQRCRQFHVFGTFFLLYEAHLQLIFPNTLIRGFQNLKKSIFKNWVFIAGLSNLYVSLKKHKTNISMKKTVFWLFICNCPPFWVSSTFIGPKLVPGGSGTSLKCLVWMQAPCFLEKQNA